MLYIKFVLPRPWTHLSNSVIKNSNIFSAYEIRYFCQLKITSKACQIYKKNITMHSLSNKLHAKQQFSLFKRKKVQLF